MIMLGIKGDILQNGINTNNKIMLVDDTRKTGGYYMYIWSSDNLIHADYWYEDLDMIEFHIKNNKWDIRWKK